MANVRAVSLLARAGCVRMLPEATQVHNMSDGVIGSDRGSEERSSAPASRGREAVSSPDHLGGGMAGVRRFTALALLALPLALAPAASRAAQTDATLQLARDRGCLVCHQVGGGAPPVAQALPAAPSFHDIAARYRKDPNAVDRLAAIVVHGSQGDNGRHWKNQAAFGRMFPNDLSVTDAEAQALVAWILAMR